MDNILYEHDYSEEHWRNHESRSILLSTDIVDCAAETGFFKAYSEAMQALPKIVNPVRKANFEYVRDICDKMAKRWGGKIRAEVRYDKWDGIIDLILPFIEFGNYDELKDLQEIAKRVDSLNFTPHEGGVRLHIFCYYFDDIVSEEEKDDIFFEALTERPELMKSLLDKMRSDGIPIDKELENLAGE